MALNYRFDPQPDYLIVEIGGAFEAPEAVGGIDLILDACEKHKSAKVLMDIREVHGRPSDMDRFNFAEAFSTKYFERIKKQTIPHCRFAFLGSYPVLDPNRFGENVAVNRGVTIKNFIDLKEALDWLSV
jgi:hypothetical protein